MGHRLLEKVGGSMGNLIFYTYGNSINPELKHWCRTSEEAWEWVKESVDILMKNVVVDEWPQTITLVAVISVDNGVEVPFVSRLVKQKITVPKHILNLEATVLNVTETEQEYDGFETARINDEDLAGIVNYVVNNWSSYRDLEGLL